MAALEEALDNSALSRILVYGAAKMRKTWWATAAAELGFNVILADVDYGLHVTRNLTPEARKRIFAMDMRCPAEDFKNCGAAALVRAMQGSAVLYDEGTRRYVPMNKAEPERKYVKIDVAKLTSRDVLIIDSWTALYTHLVCMDRNIVDATSINKLEWDDYQKMRIALDHFLSNMARLNCHVIVIAHGEEWAKRRADAPAKSKPEEAIESIRTQPMSVTRSHAATMAKHFTDVLFFSSPNPMVGVMISTKGSDDFDAGSRSLPPMVKKFDEITFAQFVPPAHVDAVSTNSQYSSLGVQEVTGAELIAARPQSATISVGAKPTILSNLKKA